MRRALAGLALLLAGCTGAEVVDQAQPPAVQAPSPADPADPHGELACDDATLDGIAAAIDGQLLALADGDYAAALSFATERFRAGTTPQQFRAVIEADYPLLIGAGYRTGTCVRQGDSAQLLVTIEAAGGQTDELLYVMARENGGWHIDVAGHVPSDEPVPV